MRPFRTIWGHSGPFRKKSKNPARVPPYFHISGASCGPTTPSSSFASEFPAGGCPQNPIWTPEGPHQPQNHVFGRSLVSRKPWNSGNPRFWRSRKLGFFSAIFDVVFTHFAKICAFRLGFLNISGFPTQVASGGFFSGKTATPEIWTCRPGQNWSNVG